MSEFSDKEQFSCTRNEISKNDRTLHLYWSLDRNSNGNEFNLLRTSIYNNKTDCFLSNVSLSRSQIVASKDKSLLYALKLSDYYEWNFSLYVSADMSLEKNWTPPPCNPCEEYFLYGFTAYQSLISIYEI